MEWPMAVDGARLSRIWTDEAAGELYITAVLGERTEQDIVYEEMFCQQFTRYSEGLVVTAVTKLEFSQLQRPQYATAVARLCDACGANELFLREMYSRGNRIFAHRVSDGHVYLVLAKHLRFGESRPYRTVASSNDIISELFASVRRKQLEQQEANRKAREKEAQCFEAH